MIRAILSIAMLNIIFTVSAQSPVLKIDFENEKGIITSSGVAGRALDLGDVSKRTALQIANPLQGEDEFTMLIWVNGAIDARESYDIFSGVAKVDHDDKAWKFRTVHGQAKSPVSFNGWKIGMQQNGAWQFTASGETFLYEYAPMPFRQNIRDGEWHLLGVSYNRTTAEFRFYYDGRQMAIYYVPEVEDMISADSLVIGNSVISEHDFKKKEWDTFYGKIDDILLYSHVLSAAEISEYFFNCKDIAVREIEKYVQDSLKVTAFNILHGGNERGKEVGVNRIIDLLKEENPDIIMVVETYGSGEEIADALDYHLYLISSNLSIISRHPVSQTYQLFNPFNAGGGLIEFPGGRKINVFAIWLYHLPSYRELFSAPGTDIKEFLREESKTRGTQIKTILREIKPFLAGSDTIPLIMGGDFNSGSHLDWTRATVSQHFNHIVPWPVSKAAFDAGLIDSYRKVHPDPDRKSVV